MKKTVELTYDSEVDAAYIYFVDKPQQIEETLMIPHEDIMLDLNFNREIIGVEILGAKDRIKSLLALDEERDILSLQEISDVNRRIRNDLRKSGRAD